MTDAAGGRVELKLLGLEARLVTDVPELERFAAELFARFVVERNARPSYVLQVLAEASGRWRVRDDTVNAVVTEPAWLPGIVGARLLDAVGNGVDDHDLFHGAALGRDGRGLILCGESGFGKSTLTLALLARGWKFLSDEIAARRIEDGELRPFPKAIEVRPGAAALLGLTGKGGTLRGDKTLHDAEELFPGCLGSACALTDVVFLAGANGGARPADAEPDALRLTVHRREDAVLPSLAELDGFVEATWAPAPRGCAELLIHCDRGRFPAWSLDGVLGAHGVLIVASSAEQLPPVDFDVEPRTEPIPTHAGVQALLGRFRGRRELARRLARHEGRFGELFLSMLERYAGVAFHRLHVGRLDSTVALLETITGGGGQARP